MQNAVFRLKLDGRLPVDVDVVAVHASKPRVHMKKILTPLEGKLK